MRYFTKNKIIKDLKITFTSKKIGDKEERYWKIYTNEDEELKYDSSRLKNMKYELIELQY